MSGGARKRKNSAADRRQAPSGSLRSDVLRRLGKNKVAVISLVVFIIICLACVMAPYLTKWHYSAINVYDRRMGPTSKHILGTDSLGRDLFTRLLYGGRITLKIAFISTVLAAAIGGTAGLAAGYIGKRADFIISPVLDMLASIPVILLAIVAETVFGWGRGYFMYAIAIAAIPKFARTVRASVLEIMGREYIEAARCLGVSHIGIVIRHVLHNAAPPFIVRFTSCVSETLLTCTVMGYLGIGINPPTPEWGVIVHDAKSYTRMNPYMMIIPCAVIAVTIISISLFGDGLQDALDPNNDA